MLQYVDPSSAGLLYQLLLLGISTIALFWSRIVMAVRVLWRRFQDSRRPKS